MKDREKLVGNPSDYGSRTLENEGLGSNDPGAPQAEPPETARDEDDAKK